jgi:colanic acid/amylovoran biosynthesis glycosyltransferase
MSWRPSGRSPGVRVELLGHARVPVSHTSSPRRPVVGHVVEPYLFQNGSWVYGQLTHLKRYAPIVLTGGTENRDQFPFDPVYNYGALPAMGKALLGMWKHRPRQIQQAYYEWILRSRRARLIHAHFGMAGVAMLGVKRATSLPLVTAFYGVDASAVPRAVAWRRNYARLFNEGDLFLAEGPAMRQALIGLGCPPDKVVIQHLGVSLDLLPFVPRRPDPSGVVRILIAATFREKKGIPDALRAVEQAQRHYPRLQVTLLGDATDRPEDQEEKARILARLPGLEGVVRCLGFQPYSVFRETLLQHHLFLSPSRTGRNGDSEGGAPVSLLEAQATGMPVLSTHHADIPEVVVDGKTGLLSPEYDLKTLTYNLTQLVLTPARWESMGAAGRAHIEEHHNLRTQAAKLEDLYDRVLQSQPVARAGMPR